MNKINKLLAMPKEEVFFRIAEWCLEKKEHAAHLSGKDQLSDEQFIRDCCGLSSPNNTAHLLFDNFRSETRNRFFTEGYSKIIRAAQIKKHMDTQGWLLEADRICEGHLCLLGHDVKLAQEGEWHKDPLEACEWPRIFYKQVGQSKPSETADIKHIWEMNRHQYLIVLGKAYWISGDEKYAKKIRDIISSWIADNPYHAGVNWTSSLELAVRSISWIWAYFYCRDSLHMDSVFHLMFLKSLYEQGRHMAEHLSYYSSPYNHLIGEAAGLHMIGSLFSQLNMGRDWEQLGWSILEEKINDQFFDDGMCVEQATFYHHFTLGFYLQAISLRKLNRQAVSKKVLSIIEKALEVSMHLTQPNGRLPAIGDIDNARSLYFNAEHSWDFKGFLSLGAVLFNRPDFKQQSSGFSEELLWLCGEPSLIGFEAIKSALPVQTSKAFSNSGYYIMRNNWGKESHYLCFDCGVMAAGLHGDGVPSAAHGHADALSFELSVFGKPILAEAGFNTYFGPLEWHRYFREEAAHNTIKMGEYKQAEYCGRLTWKSVVKPKLYHWRQENNLESVCGEVVYDKETSHRREILWVSSRFWILLDQLKSAGRNEKAISYFHFDTAIDLEVDRRKKQVIARNGDAGLMIQYFEDCKVEVRRGEDGTGPEAGWQAAGYGRKKPAWVLSFIIPLPQKTVLFPIFILPWKGEKPTFFKEHEEPPSKTKNRYQIEFSFDQRGYVVSFRENDSPSVLCEGVPV